MRSRRLVFSTAAVVVLALIIIGAVYFRPRQAESQAPAPVPVTAAVATRTDVPVIINAIGNVQSIDMVAVQPRVTGTIRKIEFTPGQNVKEGQELFQIDPRPYQAALDQARAQLAHDEGVLAEAQVDLKRFQILQKQQSIAAQQAEDQGYVVQQDKGTVQLDQANVETAQLNLEYSHVTAPISGRAGTLLVDLGNVVGPANQASGSATSTAGGGTGTQATNSVLVTITQMQPIYVTFTVPAAELDEIKQNQTKAPLEVHAYSQAGKLLEKGQLTVIDNQVNTQTGTVTLQATFANTDEALWPGEFVRVHLHVSMLKNVVTVPTQAIMAGPNGSYVYLIGPDQKAKRVGVQVTRRQNTIAVIGNGLFGGEKIVTDGQYRLDEGTEVAVGATTTLPEGAGVSEAK
jgi:membrane fusion protein, multidrug efflux system